MKRSFVEPNVAEQYVHYIHVGKTAYDAQRGCWVFVDWFVDVLVSEDCSRFTVWDLGDVAEVFEKGIITAEAMCGILRSAAKAIKLVEEGGFPLEDMHLAKEMVQKARIV